MKTEKNQLTTTFFIDLSLVIIRMFFISELTIKFDSFDQISGFDSSWVQFLHCKDLPVNLPPIVIYDYFNVSSVKNPNDSINSK